MSRRDDIQKLITRYSRRLQKLREEEALKGINTPPETLIQIEDIEDKLVELQTELETASSQPASSLTDEDLARELNQPLDGQRALASSTQMGGVNLSNISGSTITIGDISANLSAGGDIVGGDKTTSTTSVSNDSSQAQLEAALTRWRQEVEAIVNRLEDEDDQAYVEKTANKVMTEAKKGQQADPEKVEGFLNKMSNMAPDILEVTTTTLQNPFKGVGLVLQKINDRIKLERAIRQAND